jgi:uncharacterized protein YraI
LKELSVFSAKKFRVLLLLILLLSAFTIWVQAQANIPATTISILNVRSGPDASSPVITEIGVNVNIIVEGRNRFGNWVLMRSADNAIRGWISTPYVRWTNDVAIETVPVVNEVIGGAAEPVSVNEVVAAPVVSAPASGELTGSTISTLNVRSGDGTSNPAIGQIAPNTSIIIEGRNQVGDWFLMRAEDNSIRGWVASRYVNRQAGLEIANIPVVGAVIAPPPVSPEVAAAGDVPVLSGTEAALAEQLMNIPIVPTISGNAVAIYRRGIEQGRNPQHFIQVGDSNSASQAYLGLIGQGSYTLGSYGYLQSTIDYFVGGGINSFTNKQQTAQSGNLTTTIIDPIFGDPRYCPGTAPIDCELNRTSPSIAIIYLGAADRQTIDHDTYYNALRNIVERSVANNVLPILTLMPTKPHPQRSELKGMEFNMIMLEIGRQYDIPVINMWAAVRALPENGMENDLLHFTYSNSASLNFAGGEQQWGYTRWNLEVLKTLAAIRQAAGV